MWWQAAIFFTPATTTSILKTYTKPLSRYSHTAINLPINLPANHHSAIQEMAALTHNMAQTTAKLTPEAAQDLTHSDMSITHPWLGI